MNKGKSRLRILSKLLSLLLLPIINASGTTRYVVPDNPTAASPFSNWSSAAATIQDAIDAADPGDQILVTNGVYQTGGRVVTGSLTNRVAVDKAVTVQSVNGPEATVIQGYQVPGITNGDDAVRCIYLTNNAVLIGFTLTNGATRGGGASSTERQGGGIFCRSGVVVSNCVIVGNTADSDGGGVRAGKLYDCLLAGNWATNGGGVSFATLSNCTLSANTAVFGGGVHNGTLGSCTLSNNSAQYGGGAYLGTLASCVIVGNLAANQGGGAYSCTVTNCTLTRNAAVTGGGTYSATVNNCLLRNNLASNQGGGANGGTLHNCALIGNSASQGGGSYNASLYNCSLSGNTASFMGGGSSGGFLYNCILYFNTGPQGLSDNYSIFNNASTLQFCCTTPALGGTGNFDANPELIDNIHLSASSPCRGAGNPLYSTGKDIDGEAWSITPSIGCDEFSSGAALGEMTATIHLTYTNVAPGFKIDLAATIQGRASANAWEFGDGTIVSNSFFASHSWSAPGDYAVVFHVYNDSYPAGIAATNFVHIISETHYVAINNTGPALPYDSWTTAATNIQDAINAVVLPGGTVVVSNGVYQTGGQVVSGAQTNRVAVTKPIIVRSVNGPAKTMIVGYQTPGTTLGNVSVRCVYLTNGASLIGFTLTNGSTLSGGAGGGIWCESLSGIASNCVLEGNSAYYGAGAWSGHLDHCSLINNFASSEGGGANGSELSSCTLMNNTAGDAGGGIFGNAYYVTLENSLLINNTANTGGGAYSASLTNCTLVGNSATVGGGVYNCTLGNSIVYFNTGISGSNYFSGTLTNCCVFPLPANGTSNFTNAPVFVDLAGGNFRLQTNSPCIDAGSNLYAAASRDLDGRPRIAGTSVDIGAYEFQPNMSGAFFGWLQSYRLGTDGSEDYTDPDGDGLNNWQEWRAGTDPTNATSVLRVLSIAATNNPPGITVTWKSVNGVVYFVQRSTNPAAQSAFLTVGSNIVGQPGTTGYTDTTAAQSSLLFYRVGVQP